MKINTEILIFLFLSILTVIILNIAFSFFVWVENNYLVRK